MDQSAIELPSRALVDASVVAPRKVAGRTACFHCGEPCLDDRLIQGEKSFCCQGCLVVHDLLAESGLGHFYDLSRHPGVRIGNSRPARSKEWAYLDEPGVGNRLLDFSDAKLSRVTFKVPAIHCVACVWLLENLFQLKAGIGRSQVNFPRREVSICFDPNRLKLSELVELLVSIGYEPQLTLGDLEPSVPDPARKRQWLRIGVAGFAFGNIMLFSLPGYLGLDSLSDASFRMLFGWLSLALAAPVVFYSASDYWRSAFVSIRQRMLTLDVPIALGLAALYAQSSYEILSGRGEGYLDSLAGLVFFLLCGRAFQQKTHERIAFDRDYKSFFPLSVFRQTAGGEETAALSELRVGDRLVVRNGELIPADAILMKGAAFIDYSFVTGESAPADKPIGARLYAGGRQVGETIVVETIKPVSQSYLTSLWDHEAFRKPRHDDLNTLTNVYSRRFTKIVIAIAFGAALFWIANGDAHRAWKAFTSVLIVACPCALALAAPFTLGTAQRLLARARVFIKNVFVLERLAQVNAIVFDKTGTLTAPRSHSVMFRSASEEKPLTDEEKGWVYQLTQHSTHPYAAAIAVWAKNKTDGPSTPAQLNPDSGVGSDFAESPGHGISATIDGREFWLGSARWLENRGVAIPAFQRALGSASWLAIDGQFRGVFVLGSEILPEAEQLLPKLNRQYELALLSGDNENERGAFRKLFGSDTRLHFNQSPLDKLGFISRLQSGGKAVMMVGDGLNDAGAFRQSDVGVAVVEKMGVFSPASDVIIEAGRVPQLLTILSFSQKAARIVRVSFGISALYNLVGISVATAGVLSPLICAVLMPLSSVSVVLFACAATAWAARRTGIQL